MKAEYDDKNQVMIGGFSKVKRGFVCSDVREEIL